MTQVCGAGVVYEVGMSFEEVKYQLSILQQFLVLLDLYAFVILACLYILPQNRYIEFGYLFVQVSMKPRRLCSVCGKWTTAIYMHMIYSHDWTEQQVNELRMKIREERMTSKGSIVYECYNCGVGYSTSASLATHIAKCRKLHLLKPTTPPPPEKEKHFTWSMEGGRQSQPRKLPSRPPMMPPLPDQMCESERGSVLCPVPRCTGRFHNHDSLSYHCMIEHSELGAAGTPQDFSIRQYRFENKEEYKKWLYDKCEETCTCFSTKTSMWSGYAMYRCNRAGIFKTSGTIRPGTTTKKIQPHCTAFLRLSEYSDGSVDVTCCFGHIFHELDPTALRLNERQNGVIREQLEQGKYMSDICASMRAQYPPTNRLHYTSPNDIRNLALRLGLPIHLKDRSAFKSRKRSLNWNKNGEEASEEQTEQSENASGDDELAKLPDPEDVLEQSEEEHEDDEDEVFAMPVEHQLDAAEDDYVEEEYEEVIFSDNEIHIEQHNDIHPVVPSPTSTQTNSPACSECRPTRSRRAPKRFIDD